MMTRRERWFKSSHPGRFTLHHGARGFKYMALICRSMAFKTEAEKKGEEFIEKVERMLSVKDDLIYSVESSVKKPNVISPSTITDRKVWITITLFNVTCPKDAFDAHDWMRLGELGADVDTGRGGHYNNYCPVIEVYKHIDG